MIFIFFTMALVLLSTGGAAWQESLQVGGEIITGSWLEPDEDEQVEVHSSTAPVQELPDGSDQTSEPVGSKDAGGEPELNLVAGEESGPNDGEGTGPDIQDDGGDEREGPAVSSPEGAEKMGNKGSSSPESESGSESSSDGSSEGQGLEEAETENRPDAGTADKMEAETSRENPGQAVEK